MPGAVVQVVSTGPHDEFLTQNPEHSFFESDYVTYEHFAIESIDQTGSGTANFGSKVTYEIQKNADLVSGAHLEITLPTVTATGGTTTTVAWIKKVGLYLLKKVYVDIGGQIIDTHYSQYFDLWSRLTMPASKKYAYGEMVGDQNPVEVVNPVTGFITRSFASTLNFPASSQASTKLIIPLRFWFCESFTEALPIASLLFNPVRIIVEFRAAAECYVLGTGASLTATAALSDVRLYVDYVFFQREARDRFAGEEHFYIISQVQHSGEESVNSGNAKIKLNFNMPVTELLWGIQEDGAVAANVNLLDFWDQYSGNTNLVPKSPLTKAVLQLNGQDRFAERTWEYFARMYPFRYHTAVAESQGVFCIPFALNPEDSQPSGTCNFSRVDNAYLNLTFKQISSSLTGKVWIFARNLNFLKVKNGYGGLIFSS